MKNMKATLLYKISNLQLLQTWIFNHFSLSKLQNSETLNIL